MNCPYEMAASYAPPKELLFQSPHPHLWEEGRVGVNG